MDHRNPMRREDLVQELRQTLGRTGFFMTEPKLVANQVFDLVARRDATLIVAKGLLNGYSLTREGADALLQVAQLLRASPLVVALHSSRAPLEPGVIYLRYNVPLVSLQTLTDFLIEGVPPVAFAGPGGYFVSVDSYALRRARQQRKLSLDALAREVGLSRRAIQLYEEGMSAAVQAAERLEAFFGESITVPIDPFSYRGAGGAGAGPEGDVTAFEAYVYKTLEGMGWRVTQAVRCPFDAMAESPSARLLSAIEPHKARAAVRGRSIAGIARVAETEAVVFVGQDVGLENVDGTPVVTRRELARSGGSQEIWDLIRRRKGSS
jgi:putative transcriptional regulator